HYTLSPDGGSVIASTIKDTSTPRFIAEVGPDPKWVPIDDGVTTLYWIPMPASEDEDADTQTLPAPDFATPAASEQEDEHVTSFAITAKDDITVSIIVDGVPVFEGDLP